MLLSLFFFFDFVAALPITEPPFSALTGQYLLLLVVFKLIWPQATYIECIAFIANKSIDANGLGNCIKCPLPLLLHSLRPNVKPLLHCLGGGRRPRYPSSQWSMLRKSLDLSYL
jgi:hypothetical protein